MTTHTKIKENIYPSKVEVEVLDLEKEDVEDPGVNDLYGLCFDVDVDVDEVMVDMMVDHPEINKIEDLHRELKKLYSEIPVVDDRGDEINMNDWWNLVMEYKLRNLGS